LRTAPACLPGGGQTRWNRIPWNLSRQWNKLIAVPPKKSAANQALGKAIRAARKQGGFTQESFAAHADVDRSYYGAIERGEFNLTVDTIAKIAAGLSMSASELFRLAEL
jgi:DNA-binding XRE family transcriptional regulator